MKPGLGRMEISAQDQRAIVRALNKLADKETEWSRITYLRNLARRVCAVEIQTERPKR